MRSFDNISKYQYQLPYFVLLLALTPFIFNLSLFQLGGKQLIPSEYLIDISRFEVLTYDQIIKGTLSEPKAPEIKMSSIAPSSEKVRVPTVTFSQIFRFTTLSNLVGRFMDFHLCSIIFGVSTCSILATL